MSDEYKRNLIRILSKADHLQSKSSRGGAGWRPTDLVYDDPDYKDELSRLSGKELDHELRRQIIYTIPWLLMFLVVLGVVVYGLVMMLTH